MLIWLLACFGLTAHAESSVEVKGDSIAVTLDKAGALMSVIEDANAGGFKKLSIRGPINSTDIVYLNSNENVVNTLEALNLSEATLDCDEGAYKTVTVGREGQVITTYYLSKEEKRVFVKEENSLLGWSWTYYDHYSCDLAAAFYGSKLKSLALPKYLKTVGERLVANTSSLETIYLPTEITSIKNAAFDESAVKKFVNLEYSKLTEVGTYAFGNTAVSQVDLSRVTDLGYGAFQGTQLREADLSSLDSIPNYAFYKSNKLSKITFSKKLFYIGSYALANTNISELAYPEALTYFNNTSLEGIPFINNQINKNSVAYFGKYVVKISPASTVSQITIQEGASVLVEGCGKDMPSGSNLTIVLPSTLKTIEKEAFYYCNRLVKCDIPKNVEEIGHQAFYCSGLKEVTLHENLKKVESDAFRKCNSLEKVEFNLNSAAADGHSLFSECKNLKTLTIGGNVKYISDYAFYDCISLSEVTLAQQLTDAPLIFGKYCFQGCSSLRKITFPKNTEEILDGAFLNSSLEEVTIPENVTKCESNSFYRLSSLKTLTWLAKHCETGDFQRTGLDSIFVGKDVEIIPDYMFMDCNNLKKIEYEERPDEKPLKIGNFTFYKNGFEHVYVPIFVTKDDGDYGPNVVSIEYHAKNASGYFGQKEKLKKIIIGKEVESIDDSFAKYNPILEEIIFEERDGRPLTIGEDAFYTCPLLGKLDIPKGTTEIGKRAFFKSGIKKLTLPSTLQNIGKEAFYNLTNLDSLEIPIKCNIGSDAFYGSSLKHLILNDGVISDDAFSGCKSLKKVYILGEKVKLDAGEFSGCELDTIFNYMEIPQQFDTERNYSYHGLKAGKGTILRVLPSRIPQFQISKVWRLCTIEPMNEKELALGIENTYYDKRSDYAPKSIYTLDGIRRNELTKGINIVRDKDGRVRKVIK